MRARDGQLTEAEVEQMKQDETIMREKIMAAEKTKVYVNFFNKPALKLISKSMLKFDIQFFSTEWYSIWAGSKSFHW